MWVVVLRRNGFWRRWEIRTCTGVLQRTDMIRHTQPPTISHSMDRVTVAPRVCSTIRQRRYGLGLGHRCGWSGVRRTLTALSWIEVFCVVKMFISTRVCADIALALTPVVHVLRCPGCTEPTFWSVRHACRQHGRSSGSRSECKERLEYARTKTCMRKEMHTSRPACCDYACNTASRSTTL